MDNEASLLSSIPARRETYCSKAYSAPVGSLLFLDASMAFAVSAFAVSHLLRRPRSAPYGSLIRGQSNLYRVVEKTSRCRLGSGM